MDIIINDKSVTSNKSFKNHCIINSMSSINLKSNNYTISPNGKIVNVIPSQYFIVEDGTPLVNFYQQKNLNSLGTITMADGYIRLTSVDQVWALVGISTRNKIDFTPYKKLIFNFGQVIVNRWNGFAGYSTMSNDIAYGNSKDPDFLTSSYGGGSIFTNFIGEQFLSNTQTVTIDISDVNDSYYVGVFAHWGGDTIEIKNIWFE